MQSLPLPPSATMVSAEFTPVSETSGRSPPIDAPRVSQSLGNESALAATTGIGYVDIAS